MADVAGSINWLREYGISGGSEGSTGWQADFGRAKAGLYPHFSTPEDFINASQSQIGDYLQQGGYAFGFEQDLMALQGQLKSKFGNQQEAVAKINKNRAEMKSYDSVLGGPSATPKGIGTLPESSGISILGTGKKNKSILGGF